MLNSKEKYQAFQLGYFAGELLMSKGVIQPDFQFNNIGFRKGKPILLDYADIITVDLPSELTKDSVRTIKESIFSLADNYEGSFKHNSYLRAGFLARTGMLGHMVYAAARDNTYSSFWFIEKNLKNKEYNLSRITKWSDVKAVINEWMEVPLDLFGIGNVQEVSETEEKRELVYEINNYYLKNTLHILSLVDDSIMNEKKYAVKLYLDIALTALDYGMPYMAYGFSQKCKSITDEEQVVQDCSMILRQTFKYVEEYVHIVDKYINVEPIELMWILEDFDITVTK